jgi:hypothetical protein
VYLLWHIRVLPDGEEDDKLIGVYATIADAEIVKERVISQPGFRDSPDGFCVSKWRLGQTSWTEGFVTVTHEDVRDYEQLLRDQAIGGENSQDHSN